MWHRYVSTNTTQEVIKILAEEKEKSRIVAGGTDLILEIERGVRKGIETLIDVTRIPNLDKITLDEDNNIHLGPLVTHNHCLGSKLIREKAYPLAKAAWEVGSPQIRNRGTVAGNLITASPANDTITPLMALDARVVLQSISGSRVVPLNEFYSGVRKTIMHPDEMLVDIFFQGMLPNQHGIFVKHALRRAQAISLVNLAIILTMDRNSVAGASITLGAVAPTIIRASTAENFLTGKILTPEVIRDAAGFISDAATPISDVRSSDAYRKKSLQVIARRAIETISKGTLDEIPEKPVLLWGGSKNQPSILPRTITHDKNVPIHTKINGKEYILNGGQGTSLLRLIREKALLTGTKEGCAEGECGACTVFLDGIAVMGCMVPAPRAHGAEIITVEGLAKGDELHPVQIAFIEDGAVQCGYCTPGFIMSAVKLLEEKPAPSIEEIKYSITGNLCRCTGYYKIVQAIEHAAQKGK